MVRLQVTIFANTSSVARAILVLTVSAQLTSTNAVVAFVALTFGVKWFVCVWTIRNLSLA